MAKMAAMPICGKSLQNFFGQNDNHWMTFDFCTERSNMRLAKDLESRLAQA